jgi:hypothetical protein
MLLLQHNSVANATCELRGAGCCHPVLPPEGQIGLTLREICGLTTEEIARAFLVTPAMLAQRTVRAKALIRDKAGGQLLSGPIIPGSLAPGTEWFRVARLPVCSCPIRELRPFSSNTLLILNQRIKIRAYLKYELGVIPKAFRNMEMKALGVL